MVAFWVIMAVIIILIVKSAVWPKPEEPLPDSIDDHPAQMELDKIYGPKKEPEIEIPERYNGLYLKYSYKRVKWEPSEAAEIVVNTMLAENNYEFDLTMKDGVPVLSHAGVYAGVIVERVQMISDWIGRNELIRAWLSNSGSTNTVALAFYRDLIALNANRETSLVQLTRYKNDDAQAALLFFKEGDLLDLVEDEETETVEVGYNGIGYLPRATARRYIKNGAAFALLDHTEYAANDIEIPYVKIYW